MDKVPRNVVAATTLDGYQLRASTTAAYPGRGEDQIIYPTIALAEEAGELAGVVLELVEKRQVTVDTMRNCAIAEAALSLATTCGAVMGLVKKAYRNDPQGVMTPERRDGLKRALMAANSAVLRMSATILAADHVELPSVPVLPADRDKMVNEVGDVLWYAACICTEAKVSLGYVGEVNYAKLADRASRDVIRSTGDDR